MKRSVRIRSVVTLAAVALVATCVGCASNSRQSSTTTIGVDQELHNDLPASVRHRGTLRVVTDASYAPASSFAPDGRTIVGFEPDLGAALGKVLGVKVVFHNDAFVKLPPLVRSGRADMIMSAMTDTAQREQALDFVDYFSAGTTLVVQRGNPHGISDLDSLCGQKVAVETGTVQAELLSRVQEHCGTQRITVLTEPTNDDAVLQLRTGRAAALPMDYPPAENLTSAAQTRANYQLASTSQYEPGPYGIGFAKSDEVLRDTVQSALEKLIRSGQYHAILKKWNVTNGALSHASMNAASTR